MLLVCKFAGAWPPPSLTLIVKRPPATMRYIESYLHSTRLGVLLELEADDESAREHDEFRWLARDLVLQVAAGKAKSPSELLEQRLMKDPEQLVSHRIYVVSTILKTPIRVTRFVRYDADA